MLDVGGERSLHARLPARADSIKGHVDSAFYDFTSILRFIEWRFDLPATGPRPANPLLPAFEFGTPGEVSERVDIDWCRCGIQRWEMHRAYVPIENALLRQLYVEERLTAEVIAVRIGCSPMTILRRLRKYGIRARSRGPLQQGKTLNGNLTWSANLAWSLGLMATDGNLSGDGRHVSLVSKDRQLLETFRACLNLHGAIASHHSGRGRGGLRVQWSDRRFYDWLIEIGLTPAKSLTLGPLAVPDEYFVDFFRGCIDGDGSIVTYLDHYNTFKKPQYVYRRLYVSIVSASLRFVEWLQATARRLVGIAGELTVRRVQTRNDLWRLRYAKGESVALLRWMYYSPDLPCLHRKRVTAAAFLVPTERPRYRGPGRPMVV